MAVNATVVRVLKETYSREQLVAKRAALAEEVLAGVQVTQITFEGGGASGTQTMNPAVLLEHVQKAIDLWDNATLLEQPQSSYMDLSKRAWGT